MKKNTIKIAAVGDLLLTAQPGGGTGRGVEALSQEIMDIFKSCDIVFANLECTLPGDRVIPTEPRVISSEQQINTLKSSGISIVSLSNNHMFDCYDEGFLKLVDRLEEMGIQWCGAGGTLAEALKMTILECNGLKVSFICCTSTSSGADRFAGETRSGLVPLDVDMLCQKIREQKKISDHVIVSPHWGMERYRIPSPEQVNQAEMMIDAGASMILGHHPHVLQGMQLYQSKPIAYSLGNFIANDVYWDSGDYLTWNKFERASCILCAHLDREGIDHIEQIPVLDTGNTIVIDRSGWGSKCIDRLNGRVEKGISKAAYNREAFYVGKLKPLISHLSWRELKKVRIGHFKKLIRLFLGDHQ